MDTYWLIVICLGVAILVALVYVIVREWFGGDGGPPPLTKEEHERNMRIRRQDSPPIPMK